MSTNIRILAFSGSARRDSLNRKLLAVAVASARAAGAEVTLLDPSDYSLPLYHGDEEAATGLPPAAAKLVESLLGHDALLIASPEYNGFITPLLKNTLDWMSRADADPFADKVAGVVSASPGAFGGMRSAQLAQQLLLKLGCHVVPDQVCVPHADRAFDAAGALVDARVQKAVSRLVAALIATTTQLAVR
jgi:NAD(P)H-dependent FMN reductase